MMSLALSFVLLFAVMHQFLHKESQKSCFAVNHCHVEASIGGGSVTDTVAGVLLVNLSLSS